MTLQRKAFSDIITFSRASNATVTGSDGLIQYAPHNLLTYSQEFDNAAWTKARATVTANSLAAPDGTVTADKIVEDTTASNTHLVQETLTLATGLSLTVSVYAKAAERNWIRLQVNANASADGSAYFDLSTGEVGAIGGGTAEITPVGNGWYRCTVSGTTTTINPIVRVNLANANNGQTYTGDGVSGVYVWGAQLSVGPRALSYTPTTSAAVYGPRFDYDPVSMAPKGLLVEEQRTNLLTYSEQFDNAAWVKVGSTATANAVTSPDGTVDADKLVEGASTGVHVIAQNATLTSGVQYAFSIYAKAAERTRLYFERSNSNVTAFTALFDLSDGTVVSTSGTVTATITNAGNGWYRVTAVITAAASASGGVQVDLVSTGSTTNYTGDGTSGIYLWGAQLEAGSFATSYIPTVTSQVTRSADVASVNTLSPWANASAGSLYFEGDVLALNQTGNPGMVSLDDTTTTNRALMFQSGTAVDSRIAFGGTLASPSNSTSVTANRTYKATLAYAVGTDQGALVVNGVVGTLSSPSGTFVPTRLAIGTGVSLGYLNGHIRRIAYFPRRLSNAELQSLTS